MRGVLASASRGARDRRPINRGWQALIEEILADGAATGEFVCPDPRASSWRLLALLDGLTIQVVAQTDGPGRADVEKWSYHAARWRLGAPDHQTRAAQEQKQPSSRLLWPVAPELSQNHMITLARIWWSRPSCDGPWVTPWA